MTKYWMLYRSSKIVENIFNCQDDIKFWNLDCKILSKTNVAEETIWTIQWWNLAIEGRNSHNSVIHHWRQYEIIKEWAYEFRSKLWKIIYLHNLINWHAVDLIISSNLKFFRILFLSYVKRVFFLHSLPDVIISFHMQRLIWSVWVSVNCIGGKFFKKYEL